MALTEKWTELHSNKGIGFYSMHPGWAETPGVAKSLPEFSERQEEVSPDMLSCSTYVLFSNLILVFPGCQGSLEQVKKVQTQLFG